MNSAMDSECSFQASSFLRDIPPAFFDSVRIAYPWDSIEYTPKVTCVPLYGLVMSNIEELMRKFNKL